jgi:hypothetical protein
VLTAPILFRHGGGDIDDIDGQPEKPSWTTKPLWSQQNVPDGKSGLGWTMEEAYDEFNKLQIEESNDRRTSQGRIVEVSIHDKYATRKRSGRQKASIPAPSSKRMKCMVVIDSETEDPNEDDDAKMVRYSTGTDEINRDGGRVQMAQV